MFILVTYDITSDKRRLRVSDELENFGTRVNYSVFECHLNETQLADLKERLEKLTEVAEDNVRFYLLCEACVKKANVLGEVSITTNPGYTIV